VTTREEWSNDLLAFGDWPPSAEKVLGIVAWGVAEGSQALWNPLDTTEPAAGATNYNSAGVRNYPTQQIGLEAVYATLHNGFYAPILACLADPTGSSALALAAAVGRTPWGTGNFSPTVERVKADPAHYYGQLVAGSGQSPPGPTPTPLPQPPPQPEEVPVPILVVFQNAYWVVAADLTSKVKVADSPDGSAIAALGYRVVVLDAAQMAAIPTVP